MSSGPSRVNVLRSIEGDGYSLREARYDAGLSCPGCAQDAASLCLTLSGAYWDVRAGTRFLCDAPTLVYHPPGDLRTNTISEKGSLCLDVVLDASFLDSAFPGARVLAESGEACRALPTTSAFALRATLWRTNDLSRLEAENLLGSILADVARLPGLRLRGAEPDWLKRVRDRLHDEFAERPSLSALAAEAGVHRVHLARTFRERYGCTVGSYVRQRRVEFAARELISGTTPLSGIALAAGFSDQSHLTNTFRRLVGTTPGAFRRRYAGRVATGR